MFSRAGPIILLIALIAAVIAWQANSRSTETVKATKVSPYKLIKANVKGATGHVANMDGSLLYRYTAAQADHSGTDGEVLLKNVEIHYYPMKHIGNNANWILKAPKGTLSPDRQSLLLEAPAGEKVLMQRMDTIPMQVARTNAMTFYPHQYLAKGDKTIEVFAGASKAQATEFELHFRNDLMSLRNRVRGYYAP